MPAIATRSERTGHWIKMRRFHAPFSRPDQLNHRRFWAVSITITSGFRFSVHTGGNCGPPVPRMSISPGRDRGCGIEPSQTRRTIAPLASCMNMERPVPPRAANLPSLPPMGAARGAASDLKPVTQKNLVRHYGYFLDGLHRNGGHEHRSLVRPRSAAMVRRARVL